VWFHLHGFLSRILRFLAIARMTGGLFFGGGYLVQPIPALGLRSGEAAVLLREQNNARRAGTILLDVSRQVVVSRRLGHHRLPYLRRSSQSRDLLGTNELRPVHVSRCCWSQACFAAQGRYWTARLPSFLLYSPTAAGV
jgi:hypothetical protein